MSSTPRYSGILVLYTVPCQRQTPLPIPPGKSSALHHFVVVKLNVHDAILGDRLDRHALKVYWQPPLELVRAHVEDLDALVERDVGVVVLVEDGQAVVSG